MYVLLYVGGDHSPENSVLRVPSPCCAGCSGVLVPRSDRAVGAQSLPRMAREFVPRKFCQTSCDGARHSEGNTRGSTDFPGARQATIVMLRPLSTLCPTIPLQRVFRCCTGAEEPKSSPVSSRRCVGPRAASSAPEDRRTVLSFGKG